MPTGWRKRLHQFGLYYPLLHTRQVLKQRWLLMQYRLTRPPHSQGTYACNICRRRYTRMVPWWPPATYAPALNQHQVMAGYGPQAICPGCLSTYRQRLMVAAIQHYLQPTNLHILHFAPEAPVYKALARHNTVTAVDIEPQLYKPVAPQCQYANATQLPFASHSFDMVVANHILEHIKNDHLALSEMYRVLKPGGIAVLQVPLTGPGLPHVEQPELPTPAQAIALYGQPDHVRIYSLQSWQQRVALAGFTPKMVAADQFVPAQVCVQAAEDLLLALKPAMPQT